jgi:membrane-associated phospholipid phosphatase
MRAHEARRWSRGRWSESGAQRSAGVEIGALLALFTAGSFMFAVFAQALMVGDPIVRWDARLNEWLVDEAWSPLTQTVRFLTAAGDTAFLVVFAAAAVTMLCARGMYVPAILVSLACAGSIGLNFAMKRLFERPRPEYRDPDLAVSTFSFPSAHAMVSIAVYGALTVVLMAQLRDVRRRRAVLAALTTLLGLIGFSRVYLGAHYFTDVMAGFSLGFAWLVASMLAVTLYERRRSLARRASAAAA